MTTLMTSIEHSLAVAASDRVKVARFVEPKVLPVAAPIGVHRSGLLGKLLPDDFQRELNLP